MSQAQTIPAPPDFPIVWERPEDTHRFWERELMHMPGQSTELDDSLMKGWCDRGFNVGCEHHSLPVRNAYRKLNTYLYQSIAPISHDPAELEALGQEAERRIGAAIGRQVELWEGERLPEIKALLERWRSFDLEGASDAELAQHVLDTVAWSERAWAIHFITVIPVLMSMSLFQDAYGEIVGDEDPYAAYRLLGGQDNMTLRADRALYALSRLAVQSDAVMRVLGTTPAAGVLDALAASTETRPFHDAFQAYLAEWGRGANYLQISVPSLVDDPTPLIVALQDAVTQPERDPEAELAAAARDAAALTASVRERIELLPEAIRGQFEFLLDAARQGSVMQEDHNFWIDSSVSLCVRNAMLGVGRRLVRNGVIDAPEDVMHLRWQEIGDLTGDHRALVAERKAELARFRDVQAPPVAGTFPPGPPPDDPVSRAVFRMFGGQPAEAASPSEIHGMSGSPGIARGRARVVHALADGDRFEHGEVLVAPTTAPPWTPLFARASAIVTDTGGILSHCAVVAREYMIPAVVGAKGATSAIRDGQLLEVDGTSGVVRIVEE